jgi:hypothetical protein
MKHAFHTKITHKISNKYFKQKSVFFDGLEIEYSRMRIILTATESNQRMRQLYKHHRCTYYFKSMLVYNYMY